MGRKFFVGGNWKCVSIHLFDVIRMIDPFVVDLLFISADLVSDLLFNLFLLADLALLYVSRIEIDVFLWISMLRDVISLQFCSNSRLSLT